MDIKKPQIFTQGYHWRLPRMILTFLEEESKKNACSVKERKEGDTVVY